MKSNSTNHNSFLNLDFIIATKIFFSQYKASIKPNQSKMLFWTNGIPFSLYQKILIEIKSFFKKTKILYI